MRDLCSSSLVHNWRGVARSSDTDFFQVWEILKITEFKVFYSLPDFCDKTLKDLLIPEYIFWFETWLWIMLCLKTYAEDL